jgi:primosomal protein N' (replication factor Y)
MTTPSTRFVEVAVGLPVFGTFTYAVPEPLAGAAVAGARVRVPFGPRPAEGLILGASGAPPAGIQALPLAAVLDVAPSLDAGIIRLLRFVADYYQAPPGEVLRLGLPPGLRGAAVPRLRLTSRGEEALAATFAALTRPGLELSRREAELCGRLGHGAVSLRALRRERADLAAVVPVLVARGLCEEVAAPPVTVRRAPWVEAGRAPTEAEQAALARAPRRAEVLARVARAGALPLAALGDVPRARTHVAALAALGLVTATEREVGGRADAAADAPPELTAAQGVVLAELTAALGGGYAGFLLHGVTSSGKTEVYLRLVAAARARGLGAVVLVPEIALTPQLCARFRARFGDDVAVLHSGLRDAERLAEWWRLRDGRVGIALGARSAVFAPVANLGVVVVDEEHDPSFKQEEGVRYHARDVALVRAQGAGAVAVLGSATPSLESFTNAHAGRLRLLSLPERATPRPLPAVEVVDLRRYRPDREGLFSAPLVAAIQRALAAGEQTILFLNRRGFATSVFCPACGKTLTCRHCSVTLTAHRESRRVTCHYCGYSRPAPARCECGGELRELGTGTERVEEALKARFPGARVARLDRDSARGRGLERVLDGVRRRAIDIVVGTQIVTKGHDFPGVTLVGVLLADTGLALPDFRAAERTFQLLTQVAGRAGRGEAPGRVLIQTWCPEHPSVRHATAHDYTGFYAAEAVIRKELGYPPFGRLVMVRVDAAADERAREAAELLGKRGRALGGRFPDVTLLGPVEAPLKRLKGRCRYQILLRGPERKNVHGLARALAEVELPAGVRRVLDVDPVSTL